MQTRFSNGRFVDVKLEIFIPEQFVKALSDELGKINVGRIGNYDHCISISAVKGYWRPLAGASPYDGEIRVLSSGMECKVKVNCKNSRYDLPGSSKFSRRHLK